MLIRFPRSQDSIIARTMLQTEYINSIDPTRKSHTLISLRETPDRRLPDMKTCFVPGETFDLCIRISTSSIMTSDLRNVRVGALRRLPPPQSWST